MAQKHITVLIKPASDLCQMSCTYCFYRELAEHTSSHALMTKDTAERLLERIKEFGATHVQFAFQGGEPLLWGVENLSWFCGAVKAYGITATYAIQTNGLAIDDDFCDLWQAYDFLVGVSLDGEKTYHDKHRKTHDGKGTFDAVMSSVKQLKRRHIKHNILTVITKDTASHPTELYKFLKRLNVSDVQLIPCLPSIYGTALSHSCTPTPPLYASFLKRFYALWRDDFASDGQPPFAVREFDQALSVLRGKPYFCGGGGVCTPQLIVEADGSFYPCDFYVDPMFQTGHVSTSAIEDTLHSNGMKYFANTHPKAPSICQKCPYRMACGGGCRRMRDVYLTDHTTCPLQELMNFIYKKEMEASR